MHNSYWLPSPSQLQLGLREIHVWRIFLDDNQCIQLFERELPYIDQMKAARFHYKKDRNEFVTTRVAVRNILSRYLHIHARTISFCYNQYGKPSIVTSNPTRPFHFNVSHSGELALCAITYDAELGIDIEKECSNFSISEIAEFIFSPREVEAIKSLPLELRQNAFFTCWTRKEAYIKARGNSLAVGSDKCSVSVLPWEPAAILDINSNGNQSKDWLVHDIYPGTGYIASLVVKTNVEHQIRCFNWELPNSSTKDVPN